MNTSNLPAQPDSTDTQANTTATTQDAPTKKNKPAPAAKAASRSRASATVHPAAKKSKAPKAAAPVPPKAPKAAKPIVKRPAKAVAGAKVQRVKAKLVRDSFTMPQADFDLIDVLKQSALNFRHSAKKSELLRAGLQVLASLPQAQLQAALDRITPLKPGRPRKAD